MRERHTGQPRLAGQDEGWGAVLVERYSNQSSSLTCCRSGTRVATCWLSCQLAAVSCTHGLPPQSSCRSWKQTSRQVCDRAGTAHTKTRTELPLCGLMHLKNSECFLGGAIGWSAM